MGATVLIVDDQPIVRRGVCAVFGCEEDLIVVGEAGDVRTVARLAAALRPDLVLLDPWVNGETAGACLCRELKGFRGPPRVLIHTAHNSHQDVYSYYLAGADGFVHKGEEPDRLVDAARQVLAGKRVWLLGGNPESCSETESAPLNATRLTCKEQEILALMLQGHPNRRIAETLCVSLDTIKTHVRSVYKKLGVSGREELFAAHREPSLR